MGRKTNAELEMELSGLWCALLESINLAEECAAVDGTRDRLVADFIGKLGVEIRGLQGATARTVSNWALAAHEGLV